MKIYFKYYGEALAKVVVGEFLIGMGAYLASNGCFLYGAHKLLLNAYGLDKDAIFAPGCDGSTIPTNYTVEKSQLPLFQLEPHLISNHQWFWLRDVVSSTYFAAVAADGAAGCSDASIEGGVRPAFVIG